MTRPAFPQAPPAAEITVMVTENLYLVPQSAFVMVGAVVDYHAEQVKGNKVQDISLAASTQYELVVEDPEIAVARTASQVSGNRIGATTVLLTDVHIAGLLTNSIPFCWLSRMIVKKVFSYKHTIIKAWVSCVRRCPRISMP